MQNYFHIQIVLDIFDMNVFNICIKYKFPLFLILKILKLIIFKMNDV